MRDSHEPMWTEVIEPKRALFDLRLKEVWDYRDLLVMFVKRDFTATYKQSILGPLWFFIQPALTTVMFTVVFGKFAGISSDGQPRMLFYLAGLTIWNYFSECFTKTSNVFTANAGIFGKVYFPRLVMPLSIVVSGLIRFAIQYLMFICFLFFYMWQGKENVNPNYSIFLTPVLMLIMAGYALGVGMIFGSLTTRYRDLSFLLSFGVQLLMYATPVIYPVNILPAQYKPWVMANPLSPIVEGFRYAYLGSGELSYPALLYSAMLMLLVLFIGVIIFSKVEKKFMDTV